MTRHICQLVSVVLYITASTTAAEGQFKLRVQSPQPTRFYLQDGNGKAWAPEGAIVYEKREERHFVVKSRVRYRSSGRLLHVDGGTWPGIPLLSNDRQRSIRRRTNHQNCAQPLD